MEIIATLIIGAIAGWLGGTLFKGKVLWKVLSSFSANLTKKTQTFKVF